MTEDANCKHRGAIVALDQDFKSTITSHVHEKGLNKIWEWLYCPLRGLRIDSMWTSLTHIIFKPCVITFSFTEIKAYLLSGTLFDHKQNWVKLKLITVNSYSITFQVKRLFPLTFLFCFPFFWKQRHNRTDISSLTGSQYAVIPFNCTTGASVLLPTQFDLVEQFGSLSSNSKNF